LLWGSVFLLKHRAQVATFHEDANSKSAVELQTGGKK
jgi:hypothetical protein